MGQLFMYTFYIYLEKTRPRNIAWALSQCHLSQPLTIYQLQAFSLWISDLILTNPQINNVALENIEIIQTPYM